ncbi:hypothetical protein Tco_0114022 [Tanacetum coccineum]
METNKALTKDEDGENVDVRLYRSLMYLTSSRPDIMFSVCECSRFQVQPKVFHLNAVKRIFRYLKGQLKLGLWYLKDSPFILEAFSDIDYAGAILDRKSTTRGCQFLGSRLISWQCKKQTVTKIHVDNESAICVVKNPVYILKMATSDGLHSAIRHMPLLQVHSVTPTSFMIVIWFCPWRIACCFSLFAAAYLFYRWSCFDTHRYFLIEKFQHYGCQSY